MEALKTTVENLIDNSLYNDACSLVAETFKIKLNVISSYYGVMQWDTKTRREIFKLQLKRGRKSYTFEFGQSVMKGSEEPTLYDVITCLQKYDVGTFEDFCSEYGYTNERQHGKIYDAVVKEYDKMCSLFTDEELEVLQMIN